MKFKYPIILLLSAWFCYFLASALAPQIETDIALAAVNGGNTEAAVQRSVSIHQVLDIAGMLLAIMAAFSLFMEFFNMVRKASLIGIVLSLFLFSGCGPYNHPEYVTVEHNETAFVIPLEGDTNSQVKFESAKDLEGYKVSTKRLLVPKRRSDTGRVPWAYEWIPMVRVIKVNRSPVTLILDPESPQNNGIWVESSDSVGFSTGFSITANVAEEDTALFLYRYKGNSIDTVMNTEVRARIQSACTDFASREKMDLLRGMKHDMVAKIREDVVPYFKQSGITITTIGSFGGFTYENKKIQEAIDNVFVAQQEKEVASALLSAQKDKNERMKQEGEGEASKVMEIARGKSEAEMIEAKGRAAGIEMIAKATKEAGSDPLFIQIRTLEVISDQVKRWDGRYPTYMMTTGGDSKSNPLLMIQMPASPDVGPEKNR